MRENLKSQRIQNNFTQETIAKALGISRCTYTNIELGHKNPSFNLAVKIKQLLKCDKDDIFLNHKCLKGTSHKREHDLT